MSETLSAQATVDAARLVVAVQNAELSLHGSLMLQMFQGSRDERAAASLRAMLGEDGHAAVQAVVDAATKLSVAVELRRQDSLRAAREELNALLACGAEEVNVGLHRLNDVSGRQVIARVERIESARLQSDGSVWGFLRVRTDRDRSSYSWEFSWRDSKLTVRSEPDIY